MPIFSDLELEGIMNEANLDEDENLDIDDTDGKGFVGRVKRNEKQIDDGIKKAKSNVKKNSWIGKKMSSKQPKNENTITFREDSNGNIIDFSLGSYIDEGKHERKFELTFGDDATKGKKGKMIKHKHYDYEYGLGNRRVEKTIDKKYMKYEDCDNDEGKTDNSVISSEKAKKATRDLTNKTSVAIEKEKQEWEHNPGAKTGEAIGNVVTGGNVVNSIGKSIGRGAGSIVDKVIHSKEKERKKLKEEAEQQFIYRSPEYTRAMNEFFDFTDTETRKILLAVNEADQNKVLVSLTSKLYDNVVDKVDDIDFGEIEMSKGDIEKLSNYNTLHDCLNNMARLLIEFKQDTKPIDSIADCISYLIESKDIWTKAYAINAELPMVTYNTMVLAIIEATSYMVSMCVDFIKAPSQDTIQIMIDKSALTKSKNHMLLKNIESFNSAFKKGQVEKAMLHIIDEQSKKKNFVGLGLYGGIGMGAAVVGIAGLLFCIIPIIRELIFLFYYNRVRISDFFEVQADLLQVNAYNVENNRLDLTKEERKTISSKQMKTAEKFRGIARFVAVQTSSAESKAVKEVKKEDNKKYKADEVMDELPDSASSALF